jgi:hypothetical protein
MLSVLPSLFMAQFFLTIVIMKIHSIIKYKILSLLLLLFNFFDIYAQTDSTNSSFIKLPASINYHKSTFYQTLFGKHYRTVWHTPILAKKVGLDTIKGGLTPYELGGSRQTKSLKLRDKQGREYVLRSVDKTFGGALPENIRGTFIETMANDQVTISNPYGALVVKELAHAVSILHANPQLVYIPKQKALNEFNNDAGDILYFLEERPDENWETASNFAYSKKIIGTDKMLEKIENDNDNSVDEKLFVKSRLFDFYIGDWGRHEDQWRWAQVENRKEIIYKPIPRDRDNAFTKFDGLLIKTFKPKHLQNFDNNLENIKKFGFTARGLDRRLTSKLTLDDWKEIAVDMQKNLTDEAIAKAVNTLPIEVLPYLKNEYIAKLKERRKHILNWAIKYYYFINKGGVDVLGTKKQEMIIINRLNNNQSHVQIFKITKKGQTIDSPFFSRVFNSNETKEVRIFTMGGEDEIILKGNTSKGVKITIVGTKESELLADNIISTKKNKNIIFRDDTTHYITGSRNNLDFKLSDTVKEKYVYKYFKYNKNGILPIASINFEDRIHAGIGYKIVKNKWNKNPFWQKHTLAAKYSFDQKGFSIDYNATFTKPIGNWNINIYVVYDQVRWLNFHGLGNDSKLTTLERDYFRFRHKEIFVQPSLEKFVKGNQRIKFAPFFQLYTPLIDTERYVSKTPLYNNAANLKEKKFVGLHAEYVYQHLDDSILPIKGFGIRFFSTYTQPLNSSQKKGFAKLGVHITEYLPLNKRFSLSIKAGAASILGGTPEFYQYNTIGGTRSLRGFQRDRFHGKSAIYNQNELRWIANSNGYLYKGKVGLFALFDIGKVFDKMDVTNNWHYGYGGGIILSPFNKITLFAAYAKSKEDNNIHLGFTKVF